VKHYAQATFTRVRVVAGALHIADIALDCDLFIGAGGTMTREMAVLGVPTISVYQETLLNVDRYLLKVGAMAHRLSLTANEALQYLERSARRPANQELLEKGLQAYELVKSTVLTAR